MDVIFIGLGTGLGARPKRWVRAIGRQTFVAGTEPWQANARISRDNDRAVRISVYANYGRIIADQKFELAASR